MGRLSDLLDNKVYLDTNVLIYALEGFPEYSDILISLFEQIDQNSLSAFTSELTIAEVMVKPFIDKSLERQTAYLDLFRSSGPLSVEPVTRDVLIEAARLRAGYSIRLPDAIHLATALATQCVYFITNDLRICSIPDLEVVLLGDL